MKEVMITKKKARKVNKKLREHCYMFIMFNRYKVAIVIQRLLYKKMSLFHKV